VAVHHNTSISFIAGIIVYSLIHFGIFRFLRAYVLAHELTHALAGLLCGFKIKDISVGAESGYVTLSGSNAFVSLAPYCVPVYALLLSAGYGLAGLKWDLSAYRNIFVGGIGFFIAFHIIHTFETLYHEKQSDLRQAGGVVFSVSLILLANSVMLMGVCKLLYPEVINMHAALSSVAELSLRFWKLVWTYAVELFHFIRGYISPLQPSK